MSDMEGVAGVTKWPETSGGEALHADRSRLYTEEINAAVRGAFTGGATEVVVMDCHGAGDGWTFNSLIPDLLDPRCDFVVQQEWTEYTEFLEQGCDAALLVGMHAMAGTPDGVLNHTVSGTGWRSLAFNGTLVGESGINAALCGTWGCPVLMVTGDRAVCRETTELLGDGLTTVAVKQGLGRFSARHIAPLRAREMIEAGATAALSDRTAVQALQPRARRARSGSSSRRATRSSATAITPSSRSSTAGHWCHAPTTGGRPGGSSTSRSSATSADGQARAGALVGGSASAEQQGGHVHLPALRLPAARDQRAHADRSGRRFEPPAPRSQRVRARGAQAGPPAAARGLARDAATAALAAESPAETF